jgi:hypothetical protein
MASVTTTAVGGGYLLYGLNVAVDDPAVGMPTATKVEPQNM